MFPISTMMDPVPPAPIAESTQAAEQATVDLNPKGKKKKRTRNALKWKKTIRQSLTLAGQEHISGSGTLVKAKEMKPPCSCRLKCSTKIKEETRKEIYQQFWSSERKWNSKWQFIRDCVTTLPIARSRPRKDGVSKKPKSYSNVYYMNVEDNKIKVCKTMFINTLGVSEQVVWTAINKSVDGVVEDDRRGRRKPPTTVEVSSDNNDGPDHSNAESDTTVVEHHATDLSSRNKKTQNNALTLKTNIRKSLAITGCLHRKNPNKMVKAKEMKPPCACRQKCHTKLSEDKRKEIYKQFWNIDQRWKTRWQFIRDCVTTLPIARSRPRKDGVNKPKSYSHVYYFRVDKSKIKVCRTMFLHTLGVSEQVVWTAISKSVNGSVSEDRRGRHKPANIVDPQMIEQVKTHIKKYPTAECHYTKEATQRKYLGNDLNISKMYAQYLGECKASNMPFVKMWLYSKVFNEEFNLAFDLPYNSTCDQCEMYKSKLSQLIQAKGEKKKNLMEERDRHWEDASQRYKLMAADKETATFYPGSFKVVLVDHQKCYATPFLTNAVSYYLRKLWTLNYTIHDPYIQTSYCMMYDESNGARGGNEMASCFFKWALYNLTSDCQELTVWSDNCSGQNRTTTMIVMYMWLLTITANLKVINHKFLLRGHTQMEEDGVHSVIERNKRQLSGSEIFSCHDWENFVRTCNSSCRVTHMELTDFLKFNHLCTGPSSPFVFRKFKAKKSLAQMSKMVWIQVRRENVGVVYYKYRFEDEFEELDLRRKRNIPIEITLPHSIPVVRETKRLITTQKYKDLMLLMQWVPVEYWGYYASLPSTDSPYDFPEDGEEDTN